MGARIDFKALQHKPMRPQMRAPVKPAKRSKIGLVCEYCGHPHSASGQRTAITRDHILPREHGRMPAADIRNIRQACRCCNESRAILGHSTVALMLLLSVTKGWDRKARLALAVKWMRIGRRTES